jgi:hypothetical protein
VCIGPYAKQGSETGLSNIFEDLKSFCYRSDNHIIVRVFFLNINYVISRNKVHLHSFKSNKTQHGHGPICVGPWHE